MVKARVALFPKRRQQHQAAQGRREATADDAFGLIIAEHS